MIVKCEPPVQQYLQNCLLSSSQALKEELAASKEILGWWYSREDVCSFRMEWNPQQRVEQLTFFSSKNFSQFLFFFPAPSMMKIQCSKFHNGMEIAQIVSLWTALNLILSGTLHINNPLLTSLAPNQWKMQENKGNPSRAMKAKPPNQTYH